MLTPTTLTYSEANALFPSLDASAEARLTAASLFIENDDYWQNRRQYVGPAPAVGDTAGFIYLEKCFVALPKLGEIARRHVKGVVGREPAFEQVFKNENDPLKADADTEQGDWWDSRGGHELLQSFGIRLVASNEALYRLCVPPGLAQAETMPDGTTRRTVKAADWKAALRDLVYFEVCAPGTAAIYTDPSTMREYGLYRYRETVGSSPIDCLELSFVDPTSKKTVVRVLRSNGANDEPIQYDTGGTPMVFGARIPWIVRPPMFSPANIRLQNALNAVATMIKINSDVAGFPETHLTNIKRPTKEVITLDDDDNEIVTHVPIESQRGARTEQYHVAIEDDEIINEGGKTVARRTPRSTSLMFRDPVDSEPLRNDAAFYEEALYANAQQRHVMLAQSADSSGVALVEWRADYAGSLLTTRPYVERPLRTLLRASLCLAAHLAQDEKTLEAFKAARPRVDCHLNAGPISPDEARLIIERLNAKTLSRETAIVMLGTEDVISELEKIKTEENELDSEI